MAYITGGARVINDLSIFYTFVVCNIIEEDLSAYFSRSWAIIKGHYVIIAPFKIVASVYKSQVWMPLSRISYIYVYLYTQVIRNNSPVCMCVCVCYTRSTRAYYRIPTPRYVYLSRSEKQRLKINCAQRRPSLIAYRAVISREIKPPPPPWGGENTTVRCTLAESKKCTVVVWKNLVAHFTNARNGIRNDGVYSAAVYTENYIHRFIMEWNHFFFSLFLSLSGFS